MKKAVTKSPLHSPPGDFEYWLSLPFEARFAALEVLRQQTHADTPEAEQRIQKVVSVRKLKQ